MIVVELDVKKAVAELTEGLEDKDIEIRRATHRANRKFETWAVRQIRQIISKESMIPQKTLNENRRVFVERQRTPEGLLTNVWVGLNPIYVDKLGKGTETPSGIKVGKFGEYYQAFKIPRFKDRIYFRKTRERFPLGRAVYAFDDPVSRALERMELPAQRRFFTLLEQELNYAIHHE